MEIKEVLMEAHLRLNAQYWTKEDEIALTCVQNFSELAEIGKRVLARMPNGLTEVCGPLTSGGRGTFEENRKIHQFVGHKLHTELKYHVFDIWPFEAPINQLYVNWHAVHGKEKYCMPILEEFFQPLFDTKKFSRAAFIPGWKKSTGAKWERNYFKMARIQIIDLHPSILREFDNKYKNA